MRKNTALTLILILTVIATLAWGINTAQGQHAVTEGLVSYWSFDSGTIEGTTAKDSWGNNHGTIEGTPQSVPGKVGEALELMASIKMSLSRIQRMAAWISARIVTLPWKPGHDRSRALKSLCESWTRSLAPMSDMF